MPDRVKLTDRIDDALRATGSMSFYDLAMALYPDSKSWRYQSNGGPPGCFMALSAALRRGGFSVNARGRLAGPGNRIVYSRGRALRIADALIEAGLALPVQPGAGERPRWKHKNRGTLYTEIGRGKLQSMDTGGLTDNEPVVIYQGDDGQLWVRDVVEFEDGRFEFVPPSRQPPQSSSDGEGR